MYHCLSNLVERSLDLRVNRILVITRLIPRCLEYGPSVLQVMESWVGPGNEATYPQISNNLTETLILCMPVLRVCCCSCVEN